MELRYEGLYEKISSYIDFAKVLSSDFKFEKDNHYDILTFSNSDYSLKVYIRNKNIHCYLSCSDYKFSFELLDVDLIKDIITTYCSFDIYSYTAMVFEYERRKYKNEEVN